jgi:hypothetical protein
VEVDDLERPGKFGLEIPAGALGAGMPAAAVAGPEIEYAVAPPANEVFARESFDYEGSELWEKEGGQGWKGPWKLHNLKHREVAETHHASTEQPFSLPGLAATPAYLLAGHRYVSAWRKLAVDQAFRAYAVPREQGEGKGNGKGASLIGRKGTTLWISVLARPDGGGNLVFDLSRGAFYRKEDRAFSWGTFAEAGGGAGSEQYWGFRVPAGDDRKKEELVLGGGAVVPGREVLLVLRLRFGRRDTADLFIDPAPGPAEPAQPAATLSSMEDARFLFDKLVLWCGTPRGAAVDEIRFGDSFLSVTSAGE